jgi:hypothetical protein
MARVLHQIARREGRIDRVKRGETPVIDLPLDEHVRVISATLERIDPYSAHNLERKTADWRYVVYLDYNLGTVGV